MTQINVKNSQNKVIETIDISPGLVISTKGLRTDLIKRAFDKVHSCGRQRVEPKSTAGHRHSVKTRGKGTGSSRVQRKKGGSQEAAQSPNNIGGRRAHPPRAGAKPEKQINRKENREAIRHAISASLNPEICYTRGEHSESFVLDSQILEISRTQETIRMFETMGFRKELEFVRSRLNVRRAGIGTMRGRVHRRSRGFLVITDDLTSPFIRSLQNIPGIDCVHYDKVGVRDLAPGGRPGRLTVFTKEAFQKINEKY